MIDGYRTITEPLTLDFEGGYDVIHGPNASGKTTALRALWVFFEAARLLCQGRGAPASLEPEVFDARDFPPGRTVDTRVEVTFTDGGSCVVLIDPFGGRAQARFAELLDLGERADLRARMDTVWVRDEPGGVMRTVSLAEHLANLRSEDAKAVAEQLKARILRVDSTPPFGVIRSSRRLTWKRADSSSTPEQELGSDLQTLGKSKATEERARFRAFVDRAKEFSLFKSRLITVEPEIVVEREGYSVLGISELSSGERQVLLLVGQLLAGGPRVVAIEEPELSLDHANIALLRTLLVNLVDEGHLDQVILESHSTYFDGPTVIRFDRDAGAPRAQRSRPAQSETDIALEEKARASGAESLWVTRDGWTQLPAAMVEDLAVPPSGGCVWFLKGKHGWTPRLMEQDEAAEED